LELPASTQGLILVHFSARRKCLLWDRGSLYGFFGGGV
jgi:hypothetical protein